MAKGGRGHERLADAVFDAAHMVIDGRPRRAMRIYCYRCGKPGTCMMNTMHHGSGADAKEERIVARKFTDMGWSVDLGKGKHFCPECQVSPQVIAKQKEEDVAVVPMPRQMSRDDRRIIFEKLNEVYVDDKQGYAAPWTDEKVSVDLGVPRAWIAQVREEMFGPVGSNSEIDGVLRSGKDLMDALAKHQEHGSKLLAAAEEIQKQLARISKAVRP
jgi:hypothetical protein